MAEKYNYIEAMKKDVREYIENEVNFEDFESKEELQERLNDDLWLDDSITGNGSGMYTSYQDAKIYVLENMALCTEALYELCEDERTIGKKFLNEDWHWFDVSIRCYLLYGVIDTVLNEIESKENPWEA